MEPRQRSADSPVHQRQPGGGDRTHHLHVVQSGEQEIEDYRRFRDALRSDPKLLSQYETLKIELAARYADDRMRYVTEKSDWVDEIVAALRAS